MTIDDNKQCNNNLMRIIRLVNQAFTKPIAGANERRLNCIKVFAAVTHLNDLLKP